LILDISRLLARLPNGRLPTGIDRVCLEYVRRYGPKSRAALIIGRARWLLDELGSNEIFSQLLLNPNESASCLGKALFRSFIPPHPEQTASNQFAIYPGQLGLQVPGLARWLNKTHQRPIFVLYDLIPLTHPEYCRPGESQKHEKRMQLMLEQASGLISISQQSLNDLNAWAMARGLKMPPSTVAPLAPAPLPDKTLSRASRPIEHPYFVILGTIEPRKNHLLLLNLWRELAATLGDNTPHLVVIGQRGWECEAVVDMLERCETIHPYVHELNACSDAELGCYLQHAQALLFPSFAEGYGMPLVEALQQGTPVIGSNLPVFMEIAPGIPEALHPLDGMAWLQAVRDYSESDHPRRQAQLERLQHWRCPTWNEHFELVEKLLVTLDTNRA
jgi:glycosyltransferase involved in cell wall biosynthesis